MSILDVKETGNIGKLIIYLKTKIGLKELVEKASKDLDISEHMLVNYCTRTPYFYKEKKYIRLRYQLKIGDIKYIKNSIDKCYNSKEVIFTMMNSDRDLNYHEFCLKSKHLCSIDTFYEHKKNAMKWFNML